MMRKVLFYSALVLSILLVVWSFRHAYEFRGYEAVGGEFCVFLVPVLIVRQKIKRLERDIENFRERNRKLRNEVK